jgi:hypothetical protein
MYDQPGDRVRVQNTTKKAIANGAPAVLGGHVGFVEKNTQLDRWVEPGSEEATHVMPEEFCVLFIDDCHLLPLAGGLSGAKVGDKVYIDDAQNVVLKVTEGEGAKNEEQEVTEKAKKGNFRLVFDGEETGKIKFAATAKEVQEALEALSNIEAGDITVTGGPGDETGTKPYLVVFAGQYAGMDVPALKAGTEKGEEPGEITVTTKTAGVAGKTVHPLGIIDAIDTAPTPDEALVNLADLKPFLTV